MGRNRCGASLEIAIYPLGTRAYLFMIWCQEEEQPSSARLHFLPHMSVNKEQPQNLPNKLLDTYYIEWNSSFTGQTWLFSVPPVRWNRNQGVKLERKKDVDLLSPLKSSFTWQLAIGNQLLLLGLGLGNKDCALIISRALSLLWGERILTRATRELSRRSPNKKKLLTRAHNYRWIARTIARDYCEKAHISISPFPHTSNVRGFSFF